MDDRKLMEIVLILENKNCDLFMQGSINSHTRNVQETFSKALNTSIYIQKKIRKCIHKPINESVKKFL